MRKSFRYLPFALLILLTGWSIPDTETNEWTRYRGPNGQGVDAAAKAPVTWESSDFLWELDLPGVGHTSPVVWGNKIFVTSADDEKDIGYAIAIDQQNGMILWQKEFRVTDLSLHVNNNLASASPAVDESFVYFIWHSKEKSVLTALSHDGIHQWSTEFDGIETRHGGGCSLMLTDTDVVFTREQEPGSFLTGSWVAVNKRTGKTAWEVERETCTSNSFSTPILVQTDNAATQLIFATECHGFTGVDPETGEVLWERKDLLKARVVASPVYSNGLIVACRKGELVVLEMNLNTGLAADTAYYTLPPNLSPYVPTPIIVGEYLYLFMDNGTVACVLLDTGEQVWKERPAGPIFGSPVCVGGNLYCMTKEGEVIVIRAVPSYQLLGTYSLGEGSFSTPVMSSNGMIFRTYTKLRLLGSNSS